MYFKAFNKHKGVSYFYKIYKKKYVDFEEQDHPSDRGKDH